MRVTIKDLAKATNLSKTTVSLVINNKESRISAETREYVLQVAKEIGYRPNQIARSLSQNRTYTIGLLIPDIRNAFFADLAKGVEDEAYFRGYNVFFCSSDNQLKKENHHIRALADWGVDGIILDMAADPAHMNDEPFSSLKKIGIPAVLVDRHLPQTKFPTVLLDNEQGAFDATDHLASLGHKKIGCLAGALWLECDQERLKGYRRALTKHGIPYDEMLLIEAGYYFENGGRAGLELVRKGVTAIFSFNDLMAYGAMDSLESNGYHIPKDISIVGFDDIFFPYAKASRLTTVGQPAYEMGRKALITLASEIKSKNAHQQHYVFQPKLNIRESTQQINT